MAATVQTTGFYDIVKNCKGSLILDLPSYDSTTFNKKIDFKYNVDKIRVPRTHALGIFTDPTLERMYKRGDFRVEPAAEFEKEVATMFCPVEDKVNVIEDKEIINYLVKGNRFKIKELINADSVNKDKILILARANIKDISTSMVKDLEDILGIELIVENE